ncbi:MAG: hypothetical protein HKM06_07425 [Spirochaetales bacterium]|nr:hypothetical protein [Spirochaetales bacterium]
MRAKRLAGFFLAGLLSITGAAGQSSVTSDASVDWTRARFLLTLQCPIPGATDPQADETVAPKRRYQAERFLEDHLKEQLALQLQRMLLGSSETLAEALKRDPTLWGSLDGLADKLRFDYSRTDPAYQKLTMRWSLGLWSDLAPLLPPVEQADPLPRLIGWYSSRPFSGLVIYAMNPLPWKGTGTKAFWEPSLSPRLVNSRGETIFDRSNVDPAYLAKWGPMAFQEGLFNEGFFRSRVGFDPLRIVARGVWGKRPGDLILSDSDWQRLLSVRQNRQLLAEGRILILWGKPKKIEEPQKGPPAPYPDRDNVPLIDIRPEPLPPVPPTPDKK